MPYLPILIFQKTKPNNITSSHKTTCELFYFYIQFYFSDAFLYICLDQLCNDSLCQYESGNHQRAAEYKHHLHVW